MVSEVLKLTSQVVNASSPESLFTGGLSGPSTTLRGKRAFDVIVAFLLLVIVAPVFLLVAACVVLDGGPVIFAHRRIGHNGRPFDCLKFRTMRTDADAMLARLIVEDPQARREWLATRKLKRDPRITQVGRLLRVTSIDELPQHWNVLRGDMSLVGPRPVVPEEFDHHYVGAAGVAYLSVRPGVTGLWQVSGRSDTDYAERIALDCSYVRTLSMRNDIKLLFRTIGVLLRRSGAY